MRCCGWPQVLVSSSGGTVASRATHVAGHADGAVWLYRVGGSVRSCPHRRTAFGNWSQPPRLTTPPRVCERTGLPGRAATAAGAGTRACLADTEPTWPRSLAGEAAPRCWPLPSVRDDFRPPLGLRDDRLLGPGTSAQFWAAMLGTSVRGRWEQYVDLHPIAGRQSRSSGSRRRRPEESLTPGPACGARPRAG
jgi:hypothetical protein